MIYKPMWQCPECDRFFTHAGHSHSCGSYSEDEFLKGKSDQAVQLYRKFALLVNSLGNVMVAPAKTRIGFQNCRIFAAVNRVGESHLYIHIVTSAPIESARVRRVEYPSPDCAVNHLRISNEQELDSELVAWLQRGIRWGKSRGSH